jgi:hypothetical protein
LNYHFQSDGVRQRAAAQLGGEQAAEGQTARLAFENGMCSLFVMRRLTPKVSGAEAPQVRRAPTLAMKMAKPWPVLASA